jgi:hypothetical protein
MFPLVTLAANFILDIQLMGSRFIKNCCNLTAIWFDNWSTSRDIFCGIGG